ncbi:MAG TPA: VTT domain-containing protein [Burkholderiales bacterium]|nr:VTT domain-containing protein [Burkholderiales bacterium]
MALAIAALALAWRYTPLSEAITGEHLVAWARAARSHPWAPFVLVLAYIPTAFVMLPRPVLTLIGVIAFGPWVGFGLAMAGVLISALVTYYLGRWLSAERVKAIAGDHFERVRGLLKEHGFAAMFAIRIAPIAPFIVGSMLAGAARTNVVSYSAATFLGMAPGLLATSVFGTQIAAAMEDLSSLNYWAIGAAVLVLAIMTWLAMRWLRKNSS